MKPPTIPTTPGTRAAVVPLPASVSDASSSEIPRATDLCDPISPVTKIRTIGEQMHALQADLDRARHELFTEVTGRMAEDLKSLVESGFTPADVAKTLDFRAPTAKPVRPTNHASPSRKGPASFDGWFNLFRVRGQKGYALKNHVSVEEIPPAELARIEEEARRKATAKCPAPTSPVMEEGR